MDGRPQRKLGQDPAYRPTRPHLPIPATGIHDLTEWLDKLGRYIEDRATLRNSVQNATPASDLVIARQFGITKQTSEALVPPAQRFVFDSCAHVESWEKLADK